MVSTGGNHDSVHECEAAHRLEGTATRRLFRLMFPEVYTSGVSRQEEQAQLPHRYRLFIPSGKPVPPTAAEIRMITTS